MKNRVRAVSLPMRTSVLTIFFFFLALCFMYTSVWAQTGLPKRPSDVKIKERKENQKKVINAIKDFYMGMNNTAMADKIGKWYSSGKLLFGETGGESAEYSNGKITIHEGMADGILKGGVPDAGRLANLAATINHEFVHADQTSIMELIRWAQSEHYNYYSGGHKSELDAYFGTLSKMAEWVNIQKAKLDAMPKDKTVCYKAVLARDIVKLCDEFDKYYIDMKDKGLDKRKELDKKYKDVQTNLVHLKADNGMYMGELNFIGTGYEENEEIRRKIVENKAQIKDLEEKMKHIKKRFKDTWLDLSKAKWITPNGKEMTSEEVAGQIASIRNESESIVKDCDKETGKTTAKLPDPSRKTIGSLADKDKSDLYWCLCRCLIPMGVAGGYYPEGTPDCPGDSSWGQCVWGNWGCNRGYMPTSGDCFKGCAEGVGVNPDNLSSHLNKERMDTMDGLLKEAVRLIDEYWQPSPEPFVKRIIRKTKNGDIGHSAALVDRAVKIEPGLKSRAEEIKKNTSKKVSFLAGTVIAEKLDFETAFSILEKAVKIDKTNTDAKGKFEQVKKWQQDWNTIQVFVPQCASLIKDNRPCECKKMFDEKIDPADTSFTIPILFVNPLGGGRPGNDRVSVPQKEKMVRELNNAIDNSIYRECKKVPGVQSAMSRLNNYTRYRTYPNYGGISDEQAVKTAEDAINIKGICDCDRNAMKNILKTAKNNLVQMNSKAKMVIRPPAKPPSSGYDPRKDRNVANKRKKAVDIAQIDKFGKKFQDSHKLNNQNNQSAGSQWQNVIKQSDTYRGTTRKKSKSDSDKQSYTSDYPTDDYPDYDSGIDVTDVSEWTAGRQPEHIDSDGGQQHNTAPADNVSSTPSSAPADNTGVDTELQQAPPVSKPIGPAPKLGLNLVFENQSSSPVHILISGFGEKMSPNNRVNPGGTRSLHSTLNTHEVVFVAGRNGREITRATWVPPAGTKGASLRVVFTVKEKLEVK